MAAHGQYGAVGGSGTDLSIQHPAKHPTSGPNDTLSPDVQNTVVASRDLQSPLPSQCQYLSPAQKGVGGGQRGTGCRPPVPLLAFPDRRQLLNPPAPTPPSRRSGSPRRNRVRLPLLRHSEASFRAEFFYCSGAPRQRVRKPGGHVFDAQPSNSKTTAVPSHDPARMVWLDAMVARGR